MLFNCKFIVSIKFLKNVKRAAASCCGWRDCQTHLQTGVLWLHLLAPACGLDQSGAGESPSVRRGLQVEVREWRVPPYNRCSQVSSFTSSNSSFPSPPPPSLQQVAALCGTSLSAHGRWMFMLSVCSGMDESRPALRPGPGLCRSVGAEGHRVFPQLLRSCSRSIKPVKADFIFLMKLK